MLEDMEQTWEKNTGRLKKKKLFIIKYIFIFTFIVYNSIYYFLYF